MMESLKEVCIILGSSLCFVNLIWLISIPFIFGVSIFGLIRMLINRKKRKQSKTKKELFG